MDLDQSPTFIRSDLWWEDGNIIIEAVNTRFRVYKGLLATQSEIFRDMFSIPQPPSNQEDLVEGCPVVRVSDSAVDWTYILQALLQRQYVALLVQPIPFAVVAAFLRLGIKYDISLLRKEAVTRLTHDFPASLEAFDRLCDGPERVIVYEEGNNAYVNGSAYAQVINLARECHCIDFILPTAFYSVIVLAEIHTIVQAIPLSPEDRMIVLLGWANAVKGQKADTLHWWLHHPRDEQAAALYQGCITPDHCDKERYRGIYANLVPMPRIFGLVPWNFFSPLSKEVCESCFAAAQRSHNDGRKQFWQKLPSYFGLPEWSVLLKDQ